MRRNPLARGFDLGQSDGEGVGHGWASEWLRVADDRRQINSDRRIKPMRTLASAHVMMPIEDTLMAFSGFSRSRVSQ
jgi:hypothetical protein